MDHRRLESSSYLPLQEIVIVVHEQRLNQQDISVLQRLCRASAATTAAIAAIEVFLAAGEGCR